MALTNYQTLFDNYAADLRLSLRAVDAYFLRRIIEELPRPSVNANEFCEEIEKGIAEAWPKLKRITPHEGKAYGNALVQRYGNELAPVTHLRIYNITDECEFEYDCIEQDDIHTNKQEYVYHWNDNCEFIRNPEHDPDALIKIGYQRVLGVARFFVRSGGKEDKRVYFTRRLRTEGCSHTIVSTPGTAMDTRYG